MQITAAFGTPIEPQFDAALDTRLLLYTRSNRANPVRLIDGDLSSVTNSPFDRTKPVRVLIHGWGGDETHQFPREGVEVLLEHHDFNVIVIDWSAGAQTNNYVLAVQRVPMVGVVVARFLDFLAASGEMQFGQLVVIGFSLGGELSLN